MKMSNNVTNYMFLSKYGKIHSDKMSNDVTKLFVLVKLLHEQRTIEWTR